MSTLTTQIAGLLLMINSYPNILTNNQHTIKYQCVCSIKSLCLLLIISLTHHYSLAQNQSIRAIDIIKNTIINSANNNPTQSLSTYQYQSYEDLKIAGNPEAITGPGYKKKELRRTLQKTKILLSEKKSKIIYDAHKGGKEVIEAALMPGFDHPVYPIYNINFLTRNIYDNNYIVFDQHYIHPISIKGLAVYNYEKVLDSTIQNRPVHKIVFTPIKNTNNTLKGYIYIDHENHAIAQAQFTSTGSSAIRSKHQFKYDQLHHLWHNTYSELYIKINSNIKEIELLGGRFEVGKRKEQQINESNEELYLILKRQQDQFKTNQRVNFGQLGVAIEIPKTAIDKPLSYWSEYRNSKEAFTSNELANLIQLDSVVTAEKVTRKLEVIEKFKVGYYPVGVIDIDLKYFLKFNEYESFRFGIGGTTNDKLSTKWRIGGYAAYGTLDNAFKYGTNIKYRLGTRTENWIKIHQINDIQEFASSKFLTDARVYSLFEPRLINIPTFYKINEFGLSMQQRLLPSVISETSLSRKRIEQTTSYTYQPNDIAYNSYTLSEVAIAARWSPYSYFMKTPSSYLETIKGHPIISFQFTKGINGLLDSDFNYYKLSTKIGYSIRSWNESYTDILLEAHYANGNVPLTHLYHAYPNAPRKEEVLQRFSVAGINSFETMYFNEFFSDRIATIQVRHSLKPIKIARWFNPQIVLITRYAIGDLDHMAHHRNIDFNRLNRGYTESGIEVNKLLFGFGISATYRYGAYHLPNVDDNIALKFTFNLKI